jgi:micrococcal nuclease
VIWDPATNAGGPSRDYDALLPWWALRDSVVEDYRRVGRDRGALSVRLDHPAIAAAAGREERITVFCDLQNGVGRRTQAGAVVFAGSPQHPFNLWVPDTEAEGADSLLRLMETRYAGEHGRGYAYVGGRANLYRGLPQIVLTDAAQLADLPPG